MGITCLGLFCHSIGGVLPFHRVLFPPLLMQRWCALLPRAARWTSPRAMRQSCRARQWPCCACCAPPLTAPLVFLVLVCIPSSDSCFTLSPAPIFFSLSPAGDRDSMLDAGVPSLLAFFARFSSEDIRTAFAELLLSVARQTGCLPACLHFSLT